VSGVFVGGEEGEERIPERVCQSWDGNVSNRHHEQVETGREE
jgi:hypothetical protein